MRNQVFPQGITRFFPRFSPGYSGSLAAALLQPCCSLVAGQGICQAVKAFARMQEIDKSLET